MNERQREHLTRQLEHETELAKRDIIKAIGAANRRIAERGITRSSIHTHEIAEVVHDHVIALVKTCFERASSIANGLEAHGIAQKFASAFADSWTPKNDDIAWPGVSALRGQVEMGVKVMQQSADSLRQELARIYELEAFRFDEAGREAQFPTAKFQAFLDLEASRSLGSFAGYLGRSIVEWGDRGQFGQLPHLTQCTTQAHAHLFALADRCLSELKSVTGGSAEFQAMEQALVDHAEQQRGAVKDMLWSDKAPNFTDCSFDMPLNVAADHIFDGYANELHLWLNNERLKHQEPAGAVVDKPRRGRPKKAGGYVVADQQVLVGMKALIDAGTANSLTDAARQLARTALGPSEAAKVDRLRKRYMEWQQSNFAPFRSI